MAIWLFVSGFSSMYRPGDTGTAVPVFEGEKMASLEFQSTRAYSPVVRDSRSLVPRRE